MKKALILPIAFMLCSCWTNQEQTIISSFENEADLDRFFWQCHTLFSIVPQHATHGSSALRFEVYPSNYPGIAPRKFARDWLGFDYLVFDVFNEQERPVTITVRIDDDTFREIAADRFTGSYLLHHGPNTIRVPLQSLTTNGTKRRMDLRNIHALLIFFIRPAGKMVFFFDHLRLERSLKSINEETNGKRIGS